LPFEGARVTEMEHCTAAGLETRREGKVPNMAYMRQRSRSPRRGAAPAADGDGTRLYVGNLPFTVGAAELRDHFGQVRVPSIPPQSMCLPPSSPPQSSTIPSRCPYLSRREQHSRGGELTARACCSLAGSRRLTSSWRRKIQVRHDPLLHCTPYLPHPHHKQARGASSRCSSGSWPLFRRAACLSLEPTGWNFG
jgi:hypothetical protein